MKSIKKILRKTALMCLMGSFFLISIDSIAQRRGGGGHRGGGASKQDLQSVDQQLKSDPDLTVQALKNQLPLQDLDQMVPEPIELTDLLTDQTQKLAITQLTTEIQTQ